MENMKVICLLLACAVSVIPTHAQYSQGPFISCTNPNNNPGYCVPLKDCETVMSVIYRQPLQALDREFIRASECPTGFDGMDRHVCCTADTGYIRRRQQIARSVENVPYYTSSEENSPFWNAPAPNAFAPNYDSGSNRFFPFNDYDNFQPQWPRFSQPEQQPERRQVTQPKATNVASRLPQPPTCGGVMIERKIFGGVDAGLYDFPWMVLLEYERLSPKNGNRVARSCSGSLINQRYVLTAAHCVRGIIEKTVGPLVAVRLGEYDTSKKVDCNTYGTCLPEVIRAGFEELIPHELYTDGSTNKEYDIALIRLDRSIRFSDSISPVCLPSTLRGRSLDGSQLKPGSQLTVAGWGHTSFTPESSVKQKLNVSLVDQKNCERKFREKRVNIVSTQICAGGKIREDSCNGDSGGPLMHFRDGVWVLEGIISFGFKCGLQGWPGVYTRVASFENWITSKLRP